MAAAPVRRRRCSTSSVQAATAAILVLSANTAFADFPRLSGIIAATATCLGSSRAAAIGWCSPTASLVLAFVAGALVRRFDGDTTALIPLFAVGLFMSFTLSQAGMVVHHRRRRETRWRLKLGVNAVGAVGHDRRDRSSSWSRSSARARGSRRVLIPLIVMVFLGDPPPLPAGRSRARRPGDEPVPAMRLSALVLVGGRVNLGVLRALGLRLGARRRLPPRRVRGVHRGGRRSPARRMGGARDRCSRST